MAIHRDKFPETVPFRLTRMLVNAMEVSGIEGNFRSTCEAVMGMLRTNKDSVSSRRASLRLEQPAAPAPQDERMLNERAVSVIRRIKSKLAGNDFKEEEAGGPLSTCRRR